jgi:hypothetical protein
LKERKRRRQKWQFGRILSQGIEGWRLKFNLVDDDERCDGEIVDVDAHHLLILLEACMHM